MKVSGYLEFNPFESLFIDSLEMAKLATDKNSNQYARLSIISSILAAEAAANSFVSRIPASKRMQYALDRMTIIEKFCEVHFARTHSELDMGNKIVQTFCEIISFRNAYVHPRRKQLGVDVVLNDQDVDEAKHSVKVKPQKTTNFLRMSFVPEEWTAKDAVTVACSMIDFYNDFFVFRCGYTSKQVREFLFLRLVSGKDAATLATPSKEQALIDTSNFLGRQLDFLGVALKH